MDWKDYPLCRPLWMQPMPGDTGARVEPQAPPVPANLPLPSPHYLQPSHSSQFPTLDCASLPLCVGGFFFGQKKAEEASLFYPSYRAAWGQTSCSCSVYRGRNFLEPAFSGGTWLYAIQQNLRKEEEESGSSEGRETSWRGREDPTNSLCACWF